MNKVYFLVFLAPLLPLLGSFWNPVSTYAAVGLAWAVLFGTLMNVVEPSFRMALLFQAPALLFVSVLAVRYSYRRKDPASDLEGETAADDLAPAHKKLKAAVQQSEKEEQMSLSIYAAAKGLAEALSWKDMAPRLTSGIQRIFGGYEFLLYIVDENGQQSLLHRRGSWSSDYPLEGDVPVQSTVFKAPRTSEVVPVLVVPVFTGDASEKRMNGFLILKSSDKEKTDEQLIMAGNEFGEQLGMALDKAQLFAQMEKHSVTDGLTGVLRRQAFMDRLDEEFKRAAVFNTPFSVLMVDIDHFKAVNDSHGHGAGDEVLRRVGDILKTSVYETDVVGRYGGEEFIILMPKAQRDGVLRKAEQLRQRIEAETIAVGFDQLKVTVSVGVAHFPNSGRTSEDLIGRADKMLYEAKESGRNRVIEG